jgi:hypothetical protein
MPPQFLTLMRSIFDYNDKFADGDPSGLSGQTGNLSLGKGGAPDDATQSPTRAYLTISQVSHASCNAVLGGLMSVGGE